MITVMFDCKGCGLKMVKVQVPARTTEDVVDWVKRVVSQAISDEHVKLSPNCACQHADIYLPTPSDAEFIGQQVE